MRVGVELGKDAKRRRNRLRNEVHAAGFGAVGTAEVAVLGVGSAAPEACGSLTPGSPRTLGGLRDRAWW